jgi:hypothetical protein
VQQIKDTLGVGATTGVPHVITYAKTAAGDSLRLGYPTNIIPNNGYVTAVNDDLRFYIYYAAAQPHQITLTQTIADPTKGNVTITAVSPPFFVLPGDVATIDIVADNKVVEDTLTIKFTDGTKVITAVGKDPWGNDVGPVTGKWCIDEGAGIPPVMADGSPCTPTDRSVSVYDVSRADSNGVGQLCVTIANGAQKCTYVKITGVTILASSATTRDIDGCGYLDRIDVRFRKAVTFAGGGTRFLVTGTNQISIGNGLVADSITIDAVDPALAYIHLRETASGALQTGLKPTLTIGNNVFADVENHPQIATVDGAPPVILSAQRWFHESGNIKSDRIVVKFSEEIFKPGGMAFTQSDLAYPPSTLFRLWEESVQLSKAKGSARTARMSKSAAKKLAKSGGLAKSAHTDQTPLYEVPGLLEGITAIRFVDASTLEFYLENENDLKPPRWINISTFNDLGRGLLAGINRDSSNITDRAPGTNVAQRENRKVRITYGNEPPSKMAAVPNPASPDRRPVGPSKNPSVITAVDNPQAIPHIRDGGGGAVFQVPTYIPNPAYNTGGPGKDAEIRCQVKVYDLVGNLVSTGDNSNVIKDSERLQNQKNDPNASPFASMDLYWSGFNSKGMKAAPGTYRIIVYISYLNTNDPNAKNKKYQGTVGIGK